MSTTPQPLKLNYAKARQKSKAKNEQQSQQKTAFQGQSSSDLFSHLNQDNLNYIKKELKHKKTSLPSQRGKNSQTSKELERKGGQSERQMKIYQKYRNADEVTERDNTEEATVRETQVDESIVEESQSLQDNKEPETIPTHRNNGQFQKQKYSYQGLQPPPLTFTTKPHQSYRHAQLQQQKQQNPTLSSTKMPPTSSKNNFLQYELKSQTSNNQIGQSAISVEKQLTSNQLELKGSQFIDYLQNYIEELNGTPRRKIINQLRNKGESQKEDRDEDKIKDFRKNKPINNNDQLYNNQVSQRRRQNRPISMKKENEQKNIEFPTHRNYNRSSLLFNTNQNQSPQNHQHKFKSSHRAQSLELQELKRQLQKEKYYCTKLALELEKYKENESINQKEINLLQKTIGVLKIEVQNVKDLYEREASQTQKIMAYIQVQKRVNQGKNVYKQNYEHSESSPDQQKHRYNRPQPKYRNPLKSVNESTYSDKSTKRLGNQFQEFMKFNYAEPTYNQLDPRMLNHLMKEFHKGQEAYKNGKETVRLQHHSNLGNSSFVHSQRNIGKQLNTQYLPKRTYNNTQNVYNNGELNQGSEQKYLEKLFSRNKEKQQVQRKRRNSMANDSEGSQYSGEYEKSQNSLQKLKREYDLFKAQAYTSRMQGKKQNYKKDSINPAVSPKQFSHIFVK